MGCLFSCFTCANNYQEIEHVDDIEVELTDSDDYYDEMYRPRFFNDFFYHRSGYYTTD
jgi:hypothetical protein